MTACKLVLVLILARPSLVLASKAAAATAAVVVAIYKFKS